MRRRRNSSVCSPPPRSPYNLAPPPPSPPECHPSGGYVHFKQDPAGPRIEPPRPRGNSDVAGAGLENAAAPKDDVLDVVKHVRSVVDHVSLRGLPVAEPPGLDPRRHKSSGFTSGGVGVVVVAPDDGGVGWKGRRDRSFFFRSCRRRSFCPAGGGDAAAAAVGYRTCGLGVSGSSGGFE